MYIRVRLQHFPKYSLCSAHDGIINKAHLCIAEHWLDPFKSSLEQVKFALALFSSVKDAMRIFFFFTFCQKSTFLDTQVLNFWFFFSRIKSFGSGDMEYQWEKRSSQLCPPSIHKPTWDHDSFLAFLCFLLGGEKQCLLIVYSLGISWE